MHCTNSECKYVGEHLLMNRKEKLACPSCEDGILEKNQVQKFNVGGGKSKGNESYTPQDSPPDTEIVLSEAECSCGIKIPVIHISQSGRRKRKELSTSLS